MYASVHKKIGVLDTDYERIKNDNDDENFFSILSELEGDVIRGIRNRRYRDRDFMVIPSIKLAQRPSCAPACVQDVAEAFRLPDLRDRIIDFV